MGGWSICNDLTLLDPFPNAHNGSLINAGILIGPFVLDQSININSRIIFFVAILIGTNDDP
jgi:abortive infection bacteriophage resistance protein